MKFGVAKIEISSIDRSMASNSSPNDSNKLSASSAGAFERKSSTESFCFSEAAHQGANPDDFCISPDRNISQVEKTKAMRKRIITTKSVEEPACKTQRRVSKQLVMSELRCNVCVIFDGCQYQKGMNLM